MVRSFLLLLVCACAWSADGTWLPGPVSATYAAASTGVAGQWKVQAKSSAGRQYDLQLDVTQQEGKLSGSITSNEGSVPLQDPKLEGDAFSFKLAVDEGTYTVKLTVSGKTMTGAYTGPAGESGTVSATR